MEFNPMSAKWPKMGIKVIGFMSFDFLLFDDIYSFKLFMVKITYDLKNIYIKERFC